MTKPPFSRELRERTDPLWQAMQLEGLPIFGRFHTVGLISSCLP